MQDNYLFVWKFSGVPAIVSTRWIAVTYTARHAISYDHNGILIHMANRTCIGTQQITLTDLTIDINYMLAYSCHPFSFVVFTHFCCF